MQKTQNMKRLGSGSFGIVYKMSPKRIVKVFHPKFTEEQVEALIADEIRGSVPDNALDILRVIEIKHNGRKTKGLVKQLLKKHATWDDLEKAHDNGELDLNEFDVVPSNCMLDSKGKVYLVDTMTEEGYDDYRIKQMRNNRL